MIYLLEVKTRGEKERADQKTRGRFSIWRLEQLNLKTFKKETPSADPDLLPLRAAFARVVAPLAAALCLCNADRICLAVAIVPMAAELGWKPATQGELFFDAFFLFFFSRVFI